jgi:hypothetical protein
MIGASIQLDLNREGCCFRWGMRSLGIVMDSEGGGGYVMWNGIM